MPKGKKYKYTKKGAYTFKTSRRKIGGKFRNAIDGMYLSGTRSKSVARFGMNFPQ